MRHNPIWPELEKVLKDHGVSNYSIFLHPETRQLFGYAEIESEEQWASIASTEVCQRWWKHMSDIMAYHPTTPRSALRYVRCSTWTEVSPRAVPRWLGVSPVILAEVVGGFDEAAEFGVGDVERDVAEAALAGQHEGARAGSVSGRAGPGARLRRPIPMRRCAGR